MYSMVLMMALTQNGAAPEALAADAPAKNRYGNQLQHEQYRRRRGGCCGGGCRGGGGCCGGGCCGGGYGGGRGYRANYYGYGPGNGGGYYASQPAWGWGNNSMAANPNNQGYQSFYAGPNNGNGPMPARLMVFLPPNASLTIDGAQTQLIGPVREFESPPLPAGQEFTYTLRAQIMGPDGQARTVTRRVEVRAGQVTQAALDFRNRQSGERNAPAPRGEPVRPPRED